MKTLKPREWTDPKTGRIYWRVRWNAVNGKESVKIFGTSEEADKHIKDIAAVRGQHGRAVAVNADEVAALSVWREYVAGELTAGRDRPSLRDAIRSTIDRLSEGSTTPALEVLRDQFLDAKERESVSTRHLAAMKYGLKRFVSYFDKNEPAGSVTTEDVERAMTSMRTSGLSPQSVKNLRAIAHNLFQWGLERSLVKQNPVTRAKAPKVTQGEVGTISASKLKGLLRTALRVQPRAVPALALWAFCGVRRAELNRLRFDDIDSGRAELRISAKVAKTGVARFVPVPAALLVWLEAAKTAGVAPVGKLVPGGMKKGPDGQLIPDDSEHKSEGQLTRWMREIRTEAGMTDWPSNALRHSFASHAAAMHDDFSKVAAWLGHARDPRLLVTRYRHAVAKDAGEAWFAVLPTDPPQAKKAATRKPRAKKST
jgi:integrase